MSRTGREATTPTKYRRKLDDGRLRCELCPRGCVFEKEGQRGVCFVRARRGDELVLTTYGRSGGFCVDPIEKKPLYHFLPGTPVLSFGTAGCNLLCRFCQNWDLSRSREAAAAAVEAAPEEIARTAKKLGCRGVAFTYNEPLVFLEYAVDTAAACREAGIKTVAVTAGYVNEEPRADFFRYMDAANVDLKAFSERFYKEQCGAELRPVLDTLSYLKRETSVWLELTTLLIPGENDSDREIDEMTRWVVENLGPDLPWHFSAFHPAWKMLDKPATPPATLAAARRRAVENGVRYVYTGNVDDEAGGSTYCAGCGKKIIGRDWYTLTEWNLTGDGRCRFCGAVCPGLFDGPPGDWGGRRLPVSPQAGTF